MNGLKRIYFIQKSLEHYLMWNMAGLSIIQEQRGKHGVFKLQKWLSFWRGIFNKYSAAKNYSYSVITKFK
ncbi:hypothetical protein M2369_003604 [Bacillus sp. JUb11]|nr:hypothetical protein [Bacillus sp. JUb11]